jgi:hypothetical protein
MSDKYANDPRAQAYFERAHAAIGSEGLFMPYEQQSLWGQTRFVSRLIETEEELTWWDRFIARHAGYRSAPIERTAGSPCALYMCYFEFAGIPRIVVPIYKHGRVGLAQGIVKLNRAFGQTGFLGVYEPLPEYNEFAARYDSQRARHTDHDASPSDAMHNMGILLLAQVCRTMQLDYLFASPIDFFRVMLHCFIVDRSIPYWTGKTYGIMDGGEGIDVHEVETDNPENRHLLSEWWPSHRTPPSIYGIHLLSRSPEQTTPVDLGYFGRRMQLVFPEWDIIRQDWHQVPQRLRNAVHDDSFRAFVDAYYPNNFLQMLRGDGMIAVDAQRLAAYAPLE